MSVRGEARIERAVRGVHHFLYEDRENGAVKTPGPGRPQNPEQNLVLQMASVLRSPMVEPGEIVAGLLTQDHRVQYALAEIVFRLVQRWSNMSQYVTNPMNPLKEIYETAARMLPPEA